MKKRLDKYGNTLYIEIKQTIDWNKRLIEMNNRKQERRRDDQNNQKYQGSQLNAPSRINAHFSRDNKEFVERHHKGGDNDDKILKISE